MGPEEAYVALICSMSSVAGSVLDVPRLRPKQQERLKRIMAYECHPYRAALLWKWSTIFPCVLYTGYFDPVPL